MIPYKLPMLNGCSQMTKFAKSSAMCLLMTVNTRRMENAKANGRKIGRPQTTREDIPAVFFRHYPTFAAGKMNVSELARVCGLSRPTVYKYLKLLA